MRWKFNRNSLIFKVAISLSVLGGALYAGFLLINSLYYESTDNAYVSGVVVPVSAEVKGRVVSVFVNDNQLVNEGMPLLEIFRDDYVNGLTEKKEGVSRLTAEKLELQAAIEEKNKALLQVRANLAAAVSEEDLAGKELKRYEKLVRGEAASKSQYDHIESLWKVAHSKKDSALASVAGAEAALKAVVAKVATQEFKIKEADISKNQAQLDLARTVIKAPLSGRIAMKNVDPGKYAQPGQTLLAIVQSDTWVVANFKETQIKKMTLGQPVEVKVDAYPGVTFKGHIDSLQPGTGSVFSLLPPENATGNFVKVVQRIPVKIIMESPFDPDHPLWPGLSVVPTVDVSRGTGRKLTSR
ncbi:MAG: HlyD family secretion protein [Deltaproteobacteria bacterium]|nr:HlyD family secretion protein [Deltaproteobacteria bacterium]